MKGLKYFPANVHRSHAILQILDSRVQQPLKSNEHILYSRNASKLLLSHSVVLPKKRIIHQQSSDRFLFAAGISAISSPPCWIFRFRKAHARVFGSDFGPQSGTRMESSSIGVWGMHQHRENNLPKTGRLLVHQSQSPMISGGTLGQNRNIRVLR